MHRKLGWFACLLLAACTQIADFDRSKIPDDSAGLDAGDGDGDDGGMDANVPGDKDAGADAGKDAEPPSCDLNTHQGCPDTQLCCDFGAGPSCVDTSVTMCTSCNAGPTVDAGLPDGACDPELALACAKRICECEPGSGTQCEGAENESLCDATLMKCVACRGSGDCVASAPRTMCVDNQCVECDPAASECQGATPICNDSNECVACTEEPDNCPEPSECTAAGCVGCDPDDDSGCSSPTPQCDEGSLSCVACLTSGDCTTDGARPICDLGAKTCNSCDNSAAGDTSCAAKNAATPACHSDGSCDECNARNRTRCANFEVCDVESGTCVDCVGSADCPAPTPICDTASHACEQCTNNAAGDAACGMRNGMAAPTCQPDGRCDECNSRDDGACAAGESCNTNSGKCVDCTLSSAAHCPAASPICVSNACTDCTADLQCSSNYTNTTCKESDGTCVECTDNTHCADEATDKFCDTATNTCVRCLDSGDCSAAAPICDTSTHTCETCTNNAAGDTACAARSASTPACQSDGTCDECNTRQDNQCSGTETCNTDAGQCVDCTASSAAHCPAATPICVSNVCADCANDTQCSSNYTNTTCKESDGTCVECTDNTHCADEATDKFCNTANNTCVRCLASSDCPGSTPICDTSTHTCETCTNNAAGDAACEARSASAPACQSDGTCDECNTRESAACGVSETCNAGTGKCVDCTASSAAHCPAGTPICLSNVCADCANDAQCSSNYTNTTCKESDGTCVECTDNTHCADEPTDKFCNTANNTCVRCLNSDDCSAAAPICDTGTHTCETCTNNAAGDTACAARSATTPACQSDGSCDECNTRESDRCSATETCNTGTGQCVDCTTSSAAQCPASTPICASNVCTDCTADTQCSTNYANTTCDETNGQCVECTDNTHCADEATDKSCDTATNTCVRCLASDDCSAAAPICNTGTHLCETCTNNAAGDTACAARSASTPACQSDGICGECNGRTSALCILPEVCDTGTGVCG